ESWNSYLAARLTGFQENAGIASTVASSAGTERRGEDGARALAVPRAGATRSFALGMSREPWATTARVPPSTEPAQSANRQRRHSARTRRVAPVSGSLDFSLPSIIFKSQRPASSRPASYQAALGWPRFHLGRSRSAGQSPEWAISRSWR